MPGHLTLACLCGHSVGNPPVVISLSTWTESRFDIGPKSGSKMLWRPNQLQLTGVRATNLASYFLSDALDACSSLKKARCCGWGICFGCCFGCGCGCGCRCGCGCCCCCCRRRRRRCCCSCVHAFICSCVHGYMVTWLPGYMVTWFHVDEFGDVGDDNVAAADADAVSDLMLKLLRIIMMVMMRRMMASQPQMVIMMASQPLMMVMMMAFQPSKNDANEDGSIVS